VEETNTLAVGERPHESRRARSNSTASQSLAKTPARSFYHRSFRGHLDPAEYSTEGLKEQTAQLASYKYTESPFGATSPPRSPPPEEDGHIDAILEVSEPVTPEEEDTVFAPHESALANMLHLEEDQRITEQQSRRTKDTPEPPKLSLDFNRDEPDEHTSLLADRKVSGNYGDLSDLERQHIKKAQQVPKWMAPANKLRSCGYTLVHPKTWSARAIAQNAVVRPAKLLPAVILGLLLNILDALSYGMILFPLGHAMFDDLGSDGIAMFYVSTIIAQITYSAGGSIFKGGIGSEMIEVVPFMHKMAFTILNKVGEDNPKSVLATTILAFSVSSVLTGIVFFLLGACRLGSLIGFFPRHILIGCIGGVGFFLFVTGIEVSARLPGNLEYNLATLKQLFRQDTVGLWILPLGLAIVLKILQHYVKSKMLVGGYFISVGVLFYIFKFALHVPMDTLHSQGWVFDSPPAGNPWYHFWTLYDFKEVDWAALGETIPAMFALTFFGILHVPINVPALGIATNEDNLNVDRELVAHGISNSISGLFGSVQNYLVYTNSLLFMDSGGSDRLAGLMLAAATFGVLIAGPAVIGFIPVCVVGALIFLLGIDLLEEALFETWGKVQRLEYLTIVVIVVTMGVWDFVVGIFIGIILAALNFVVQTSRRTAIRATYSGEIANSTVRRPPLQHRFLKEAGRQIFLIKLSGFLFFGTIVGVENRIRALLEEEAFDKQPLRFLILDMTNINGIDYSAAEAFTRINRLLQKRGVVLCVSGIERRGDIWHALEGVALFSDELDVRRFPDLNDALQSCENELLRSLSRHQARHPHARMAPIHLDVPRARDNSGVSSSVQTEMMISSPRRNQLARVAETAVEEVPTSSSKWQDFAQPLPLLLEIFEGMTDRAEDFWFKAGPYFVRRTLPQGSVLFEPGDAATGFFLLEEGLIRGEYELPQGRFAELIARGRPFGELPFFSQTPRTARMVADKDSVVWELGVERWRALREECPEVAQELLMIGLKLTKERMDVITSFVLTTAG
jgi:sulfate permease, SulP family